MSNLCTVSGNIEASMTIIFELFVVVRLCIADDAN